MALGSFLGALWSLHAPAALAVALSDTASAWLAALLYRRVQDSFPWLGALRNGFSLLVAAAVVALLSSVCAGGTLAWLYSLPAASAQEMQLTWFLGDSLGVIIAGPVFILLHEWVQRPTRPSKQTVLWMLATLLIIACAFATIGGFPERKGLVFLLFLTPFVACSRLNEGAVKLSVFVTVLVLLFLVKNHGFTLVNSTPDENRLALVIFIAGYGITWLIVVADPSQRFRGLPFVVLIFAGLIGSRLFGKLEQDEREKAALQVDQVVTSANSLLRAHTDNFLEALRPTEFLLHESPRISSGTWADYFDALKLSVHYKGMRGLGVVYPVKSEKLEEFFAVCHQRDIALSSLSKDRESEAASAVPGGDHMILTLVQPQNLLPAVGIDFATYPYAQQAAETARNTGSPQMTRSINAFRNIDGSNLMIFWPVYQRGAAPKTIDARRAQFYCWIMASFDLSGIEENVLKKIPQTLELSIYQGKETPPEALIYRRQLPSNNGTTVTHTRTSSATILNRSFTWVWGVGIDYDSWPHARAMAGSVGIILAGAFLGSLVLNLRNFGHRLEKQVVARTKELQLANLALIHKKAEIRKLAYIATEARNPIFLTRGNLTIEWINRAFSDFYGYTLEDVFGKRTKDILMGPDSDLGALGTQRDTFYVKKEPVSYEIFHYTKSGKKVWVSVSLRPILDQAGEFEHIIGVVTDLTATKETQLSLEAARAAADEANEAKSALIANVSHELRTPLNVIMGNLQLLLAGNFGRVEDAQVAPLRRIEESSQHLLLLIGDLLDVSKVQAGMLELKIGPVNVTALGDAALAMLRSSAKFKHLELKADYHHRTDLVAGDALRLKQVLINLLSNAVKFTPERGPSRCGLRRRSIPPSSCSTSPTPEAASTATIRSAFSSNSNRASTSAIAAARASACPSHAGSPSCTAAH